MSDYKINKEDSNKTILNYINDAHDNESTSSLRIEDNLQTKMSDFTLSFYAKHLPKALHDLVTEGVKIKGELRKIVKDISTGNVALYDEVGDKVIEEKIYMEEFDTMNINSIDYLLQNSYKSINNNSNKNKYKKAIERMSEIKIKSTIVNKCSTFIDELYKNCLMIPSVVYIGSTDSIQLRWKSENNVTVFTEININTRRIDGYLSFNSYSRDIDIDLSDFKALYNLISELEMYGI